MNVDSSNMDAVVVIGGGFAGLTTALTLRKGKNPPNIILVEPRERFTFLPLLYELLSGELKAWEVAPFYSELLGNTGIAHIQDSVESIDMQKKIVKTVSGKKISYAQLVVATGSKPYSFGVQGVQEFAFRFHQFEDITKIRGLIAEFKKSSEQPKCLSIVGAGPTGVELTCKIADITKNSFEINLIERGDCILANSKSFNQEQALKALKRRKINLFLNTEIIEMNKDQAKYQSVVEGDIQYFVLNHTSLIWTAGSKPFLPRLIDKELQHNDLMIDSCLRLRGSKDVFVLGDLSCRKDSDLYPSAQLAIQQGNNAAFNIESVRKGESMKPFSFIDQGEMLSIGLGEATITGLGLTIAGRTAFNIRRLAYLTKLPRLSLGIRSGGSWLIDLSDKIF